MSEATLRRGALPDKPLPQSAGVSPTDAELLSRFVECQDQPAFEAMVRRHGTMVMGVCRRVLNHPEDAEDAFQATFLVLARKSSKIRRPELLGNWLYGVAYRSARKLKSMKPKAIAMSDALPPVARPGHDVAREEIHSLVDQELHQLPERDRLVLTLCYFQGLTHAEVAQRLGWRQGSVSRRVAHGRKLLRARLSRRGITLSVGGLALLLAQMRHSQAVASELISSTVRASAALAAGSELDTIVSLRVAALVRSFFATPLSLWAILLTSLLLLGPCALLVDLSRPSAAAAAEEQPGARLSTSTSNGVHGAMANRNDRQPSAGGGAPSSVASGKAVCGCH